MRASLAAAALAAGLAAAAAADAQTMYKWIDAQGKTQYSDRPPKGFKGDVTRIETDPAPILPPAVPRAPAPPAPAAEPSAPVQDLATQRRVRRERLEARLERARTNLERAKKALAEAPGPDLDERQVIQQRVKGAGGNMHAMTPRSNCRDIVDANGAKATICPSVLPGPAYYDRLAALEKAVRVAEEDLEEAERAYRRGRD